jgi:hypothetical protein
MEVMTRYQIAISNSFAAVEILHDRESINRAWENFRRIPNSKLKIV